MRPVNLIPTEQRRSRPSGNGSGSAYVIVGLLSVLLVMAVAYVLTSNKVNANKTAAQEARQEADSVKAELRAMNSFTDFASIKEQRLGSVLTTAQTRFDWERLMREVSLIMPEGSWLQTADASTTGDPAAAGAVAAAAATGAAAAPAGPAATFVGCTRRQSEVATLMVRMREMHRATDVELNESTREQQSGGDAGVESCGSYYKFDVTVSFEPAAPVKEAPRGSLRVPASLGGGS
jgi:Tfp pilus assembly protein PilN